MYSEKTDTRYFSDNVTFVTGNLKSTHTRVREYRCWYSEQTDTRYFSDSVTFVTGDLEST